MLKTLLPILTVLLATSSASAADVAQEKKTTNKLGDVGSFSLALEGAPGRVTPREGTVPGTDLVLRVQTDLFVARRVSVGVSMPLEYRVPTGSNAPPAYFAGVFPMLRVGALFPISERVSVWPGVQLGCGEAGWPSGIQPRCGALDALFVGADARLSIEIFPHAYLSASPIVARVGFSRAAADAGSLGPVFLSTNFAASAVF